MYLSPLKFSYNLYGVRLMTLPANALILKFFPTLESNHQIKNLMLALLGTGLMALAAQMQIPLDFVKVSMQSFVCIFLGCLLGARLGAATMMLYLMEGAVGLPVFQNSSSGLGLLYFMGPTGGYLVGFVAATFVAGTLWERNLGRTIPSAALLFALSSWVLDACGVGYLTILLGFDKAIGVYLSYQLAFALKLGLFATSVGLLNAKSTKTD